MKVSYWGYAYSGLSGRVSHTLSLRGPCFTVDTACSATVRPSIYRESCAAMVWFWHLNRGWVASGINLQWFLNLQKDTWQDKERGCKYMQVSQDRPCCFQVVALDCASQAIRLGRCHELSILTMLASIWPVLFEVSLILGLNGSQANLLQQVVSTCSFQPPFGCDTWETNDIKWQKQITNVTQITRIFKWFEEFEQRNWPLHCRGWFCKDAWPGHGRQL